MLKGKTLFISGGSRGIGLAIALRAARDGANVTIAAKTADPHPRLPGTIFTAAEEIKKAGGRALPIKVDIRFEEQVTAAMDETVKTFGCVDILINNASAINLSGTANTAMKRFDLMHQINTRGTFLCSQAALPFLKESSNPHILNLSPPLNMNAEWFAPHLAYTMAKYGMSMCVLGMAEEFRQDGIAVNALWPRTIIQTVASQMIGSMKAQDCRTPEIMADAAYAILTSDARTCTGNFFIDEDILAETGMTNFDKYLATEGGKPLPDLFLD